jgi:hypothetical protein
MYTWARRVAVRVESLDPLLPDRVVPLEEQRRPGLGRQLGQLHRLQVERGRTRGVLLVSVERANAVCRLSGATFCLTAPVSWYVEPMPPCTATACPRRFFRTFVARTVAAQVRIAATCNDPREQTHAAHAQTASTHLRGSLQSAVQLLELRRANISRR